LHASESLIRTFDQIFIVPVSAESGAEAGPAPLAPYQKIVAKANKPRIIDFGATWCPACQAMQSDWAEARQRYGDRVDFVSIDWDKGDPYRLIYCYGVRTLPTIVFLDRKGIEINRQVGWPPPHGLPPMIESALRQ
jgi:thioredoxin 1